MNRELTVNDLCELAKTIPPLVIPPIEFLGKKIKLEPVRWVYGIGVNLSVFVADVHVCEFFGKNCLQFRSAISIEQAQELTPEEIAAFVELQAEIAHSSIADLLWKKILVEAKYG